MLKSGDTFERYTIETLLGEGGMGAVYRARDAKLGRNVALKVIADTSANAEADARLIREARAAAAIDHPNAVSIFDVGEHEGAPFIVMELVEGRTLRHAVGDASLPMAKRVAQLADVARALASAHRRGVVHRDIKPENVMVRDDGMVKVLDFGIARRTSAVVDPNGPTTSALPTLTVEGVKLGTPVYMAPEQIRGDALDGRADQFAWGVLAYEVFTARLPWRGGDALAVMASVLTDPVERAPLGEAGVPKTVEDVVLRALSKRREDRFASMDDLLRALDGSGEEEREPVPKGATEAQRFSTGEVREVLGKALDRQAAKQASTKLGFEDLLAVAAEVGIDPESLREASRALRKPEPSEVVKVPEVPERGAENRARIWVRRRRRAFARHAGVYAIVNGALLVLGLVLLGPWTPWWVWFLPGLGWGIGLLIHMLVALTANEDDWRHREETLQWWREHSERHHDRRMAAISGRRAEPQRIAPPTKPVRERERLRVAAPMEPMEPMDTTRERQAEDEAALAEPREERRRR
jgi:serine/threonine-protein kinase